MSKNFLTFLWVVFYEIRKNATSVHLEGSVHVIGKSPVAKLGKTSTDW